MIEITGTRSAGGNYFKALDGTIYEIKNGKAKRLENQEQGVSLFDADVKVPFQESVTTTMVGDEVTISQPQNTPSENKVFPSKKGGYYVKDDTAPAENCGYRFYNKEGKELTREQFMVAEQQYMDKDGTIKPYDWKAKLKSRGKGVVNFFANMCMKSEPVVDENGDQVYEKNGKPKMKRKFNLKQTLKTAAICGGIAIFCAATAGTGAPAVLTALFAIGAGARIIKGEIKNSDENRSPEEKMETGEEIGENTVAFGLAAVGFRGAKGGIKSFKGKVAAKNNAIRATKGKVGVKDVIANRASTFKEVVSENVGNMWKGIRGKGNPKGNEGRLEDMNTEEVIEALKNKSVNDIPELQKASRNRKIGEDSRAMIENRIRELKADEVAQKQISKFSDEIAKTKPDKLDALKNKIEDSNLNGSQKQSLEKAIEAKAKAAEIKGTQNKTAARQFEELIDSYKGNKNALDVIQKEIESNKALNNRDKVDLYQRIFEKNPDLYPEVTAELNKMQVKSNVNEIENIKNLNDLNNYERSSNKSLTSIEKEALQRRRTELFNEEVKEVTKLEDLEKIKTKYEIDKNDYLKTSEKLFKKQTKLINDAIEDAATPEDLLALSKYKDTIAKDNALCKKLNNKIKEIDGRISKANRKGAKQKLNNTKNELNKAKVKENNPQNSGSNRTDNVSTDTPPETNNVNGNGNKLPKIAIIGTALAGENLIDQAISDGEVTADDEEIWEDGELESVTPEPETPEVKPETPDGDDGDKPEVKPETLDGDDDDKPKVKPETPEVKPETPEVKPETPEVKPETPEVKPETPDGDDGDKPEPNPQEVFSITKRCQEAMKLGKDAINQALGDLAAVGAFRGKNNLRRMLKNQLKEIAYKEQNDGAANTKYGKRISRREAKALKKQDKVDPRYDRKAQKRGYTGWEAPLSGDNSSGVLDTET